MPFKSILNAARAPIALARRKYTNFKFYDLGRYAINYSLQQSGYQLHTDIAYGVHPRQRLDLYVSEKPRLSQPLLVFVHGGAWSEGDKAEYTFLGESFIQEGFNVAIINYRLAPEYIFPSSVDDLILALNFLHEQHELATQDIVLLGHSAGAFNVMSALYTAQNYHLSCQQNIRAIIGLAGPYHFDYKDDPLCANAFDQQLPYRHVMPYYFVQPNSIKHYLFMAKYDKIVHPKNALDFHDALIAKGNHSQIINVPLTGHITLMGSLAQVFSRYFSTKKQIVAALNDALGPLD